MSSSNAGSRKGPGAKTPQELQREVEQVKLEAEAVLLKIKRLEIETELARLRRASHAVPSAPSEAGADRGPSTDAQTPAPIAP
ncbi:MAG TPA: hypothetical protein EYH34_09650, partial [Planctomycetes bacterium]|nr:hypothetical protein [Planctomycetota bacterium]